VRTVRRDEEERDEATSPEAGDLMPGRYRARDVLLVPGLLSLARIPLAVCFAFASGNPTAALVVLVLAGCTDVLDGWAARRLGQVTPTGVVLDGITDKLFALTVAVTLVVDGRLSVLSVLLLSSREIVEFPLLLRYALSRRARQSRAERPTANVFGKLATVLQFVAIGAALLRAPQAGVWIAATAVVGAIAGISYWRAALRHVPAGREDGAGPSPPDPAGTRA
jgi:cardiolipin synthase (CMP-forming)